MKITIEQDGYQLVVDQQDVSVTLSTETEEIACDCPKSCGYVHRRLRPGARLELVADLPVRPGWEPVS